MSGRLLILGCSQRKVGGAAPMPAVERYDGPAYRTLRAHRDRGGTMPRLLILSASFGLIDGGRDIPSYDYRMSPSAAAKWSASNKDRTMLLRRLARADECLVVAGRDYVSVIDAWAGAADPWSRPYRVAEGGIGVKLGVLRRWLEEMT